MNTGLIVFHVSKFLSICADAIFDSCRSEQGGSVHCYHLMFGEITQSEATGLCPGDSYLAIVETEEERQFLSTLYIEGK